MSAREEMEKALSALRLQVPAEVADDVTRICREAVTEAMLAATYVAIMEFEPKPGVTIKLTIPSTATAHQRKEIMAMAATYFPDNKLIGVTDNIDFATEEES